MDFKELFPALNGIVGGVIMALVGWLVGTGKLHLGRETALYKNLWDEEKVKSRQLQEDQNRLVEIIKRNNDTLTSSAEALARANNDVAEVNRMLRELVEARRSN
jgi:phosphate/sulfate permease